MSSVSSSAVEIRTSPDDLPSIPPWFAEVVVLASYFSKQGYLDAINQQVRLARGRAGTFEVIDFVAILLGYAVSAEPTLQAFFERLAPFAQPFMALFGRQHLPHRATLCRFLADVDAACRDALRHLFLNDLLLHGCSGGQRGGFMDRQAQPLLVFDVDGTRQAARQRALASSPDLPQARRRLDAVCAPGYTGRKRGEVVRTRTTVLQAHSQEWLGTFSNLGNGEYGCELEAACGAISAYLAARNLVPAQALLRLDGLYGTIGLLARIQPFQLGFLTRGREYRLLDLPVVQARLSKPPDASVTHPESQVQRELFDVGFVADWLPEQPQIVVSYRVLVARRPPPADAGPVSVGALRDGFVYELFLTSQPASSLPATTVLELYQQRGSFEQVLSDEDGEQIPDRWCSHTPYGQEFWQVLNQWVWNIRLRLGLLAQPEPLRWTAWATAEPRQPSHTAMPRSTVEEVVAGEQVAEPSPPTPAISCRRAAVGELVPQYGPLELAQPWAKARQRFSSQEFRPGPDDTLTCPAGKVLRLRERRAMPNGELRVVYAARAHDCRTCELAAACLGRGASGEQPRRVSGMRRVVGWQEQPKGTEEQVESLPAMAEQQPQEQQGRVLQWGDVGGRRVRRDLVKLLRCQQVSITRRDVEAVGVEVEQKPRLWTRAERAHRRQSWANRLARNACDGATPRYTVTLAGIAPALAAFLGLPSSPAS